MSLSLYILMNQHAGQAAHLAAIFAANNSCECPTGVG